MLVTLAMPVLPNQLLNSIMKIKQWLQKIAQNQYRYSSDLEKSEKKHRREGKDLKKKKKVVEDIFSLVSRVEESFSGFGYGVEVN